MVERSKTFDDYSTRISAHFLFKYISKALGDCVQLIGSLFSKWEPTFVEDTPLLQDGSNPRGRSYPGDQQQQSEGEAAERSHQSAAAGWRDGHPEDQEAGRT